jgi:hypothetical protein
MNNIVVAGGDERDRVILRRGGGHIHIRIGEHRGMLEEGNCCGCQDVR